MSKNFNYVVILLLLQSFAQGQHSNSRIESINNYLQRATEKMWFSGSVLVYKDNEVVLSKGYGLADFENKIGNTPTTKFRIASLSKQFTAACVMKLVEMNLLNLDQSVENFFPFFPKADKITIHHLLSHTSGIIELSTLQNFDSLIVLSPDIEFIINYLSKFDLNFEPGAMFEYSNSGYIMLTRIIELVSNQTFEEYLSENILIPLEMRNSGVDAQNILLTNRARGYNIGMDDNLQNARYFNIDILGGAGGLYSNVQDMVKWYLAYKDLIVLNTSSWERMLTPNMNSYGYGLFITEYNGRRVIMHGGGLHGYASHIFIYPEENTFFIILKNIDNLPKIFDPVQMIHSVLYNEEYTFPSERKKVSLNTNHVESFLGDYELKPGFIISIIFENGKLYAQATGQPRLEIIPETENLFYLDELDATIEFNENEKKESILILHQSGRDFVGIKIQ